MFAFILTGEEGKLCFTKCSKSHYAQELHTETVIGIKIVY